MELDQIAEAYAHTMDPRGANAPAPSHSVERGVLGSMPASRTSTISNGLHSRNPSAATTTAGNLSRTQSIELGWALGHAPVAREEKSKQESDDEGPGRPHGTPNKSKPRAGGVVAKTKQKRLQSLSERDDENKDEQSDTGSSSETASIHSDEDDTNEVRLVWGELEPGPMPSGDVLPSSGASKVRRPGRRSIVEDDIVKQLEGVKRDRYKCWDACFQHAYDIIDPRSQRRQIWDLVIVLLLLYNLIEIPVRVCFDVDVDPWSPADIINLVVDLCFVADVVVNFRTGFFKNALLVTDPRRIAARYMKGWFWLDFLTAVPLSHIVNIASGGESSGTAIARLPRLLRIFRIARLFKLMRIFKLMKTINEWDTEDSWIANQMRVLKFMILVFFISHTAACVWMLIAMLERDDDGYFVEDSWPVRYHLPFDRPEDISLGRRYLIAMYWSITTVTTVGYGDVTPGTNYELIWATVIMFVGAIAFGYIVGNISLIVNSEDETSRIIRDKIREISSYMHFRQLSRSLRDKIQAHYEYSWKRTSIHNESQILDELPAYLRMQVAQETNAELIKSVPFLRDSGQECVALLTTKLRPLQLAPDAILFEKGSVGTEMYFVHEGEMEVFAGDPPFKRKQLLCVLEHGGYFGEYSLLADAPPQRTATVRARTFADLSSLTLEDFRRVLDYFPSVREDVIAPAKKRLDSIMQPLIAKQRRRERRLKEKAKRLDKRDSAEASRHTSTYFRQSSAKLSSPAGSSLAFSRSGAAIPLATTGGTADDQKISGAAFPGSEVDQSPAILDREISSSSVGGISTIAGREDFSVSQSAVMLNRGTSSSSMVSMSPIAGRQTEVRITNSKGSEKLSPRKHKSGRSKSPAKGGPGRKRQQGKKTQRASAEVAGIRDFSPLRSDSNVWSEAGSMTADDLRAFLASELAPLKQAQMEIQEQLLSLQHGQSSMAHLTDNSHAAASSGSPGNSTNG